MILFNTIKLHVAEMLVFWCFKGAQKGNIGWKETFLKNQNESLLKKIYVNFDFSDDIYIKRWFYLSCF